MTALEGQNYRVSLHSGRPSGQPLSLESCQGVCLVASQASSYIQHAQGADLLALSQRCQDVSRPLVLVALETGTAKTFRRLGLPGRKILLWDTKSFWPSLRATIPPSTISRSPAVNNQSVSEKDTWTYVRKSGNDSSLSTQSTDTMTAFPAAVSTSWRGGGHLVNSRRSSTLQRVPPSSQLPSQNRLVHQSLVKNRTHHGPRVIENPMHQHEDEPIYHSLDEGEKDKEDDDVTVYINADLEVVYPSLPLPLPVDQQPCQKGQRRQGMERDHRQHFSDEDEEELNGLLADCYENQESLLRRGGQGYVPSPAPGTCPRGGQQRPSLPAYQKSSTGYLV